MRRYFTGKGLAEGTTRPYCPCLTSPIASSHTAHKPTQNMTSFLRVNGYVCLGNLIKISSEIESIVVNTGDNFTRKLQALNWKDLPKFSSDPHLLWCKGHSWLQITWKKIINMYKNFQITSIYLSLKILFS